jgi:hypothetical protein
LQYVWFFFVFVGNVKENLSFFPRMTNDWNSSMSAVFPLCYKPDYKIVLWFRQYSYFVNLIVLFLLLFYYLSQIVWWFDKKKEKKVCCFIINRYVVLSEIGMLCYQKQVCCVIRISRTISWTIKRRLKQSKRILNNKTTIKTNKT